MARALPVPIYTTTAQLSAPFASAQFRALSSTSPGTTDSTATLSSTNLVGGIETTLTPEASNAATTSTMGTIDRAWVLPLDGAIRPTAADTVTFFAGTFVWTHHYSRNNPLGGSNIANVTVRVRIMRVAANGTTVLQTLGEGTALIASVTTTEASIAVNVPTAEATFAPGEFFVVQVNHETSALSLVATQIRCHTNSTTGSRITAGPDYRVDFVRSVSDNTPVADSVARQYTGSRELSDSMPVTDSLARAATFRRTMTDTMPVADSLARVFTANRALADNMPVNDALARRFTGSRNIADNVPVNDAITRRVTYARALLEAYREGGGSTIINVRRPVYVVED